MVFSSVSFLFMFLPLVLLLYFALKNRTYKNAVLLLSSLLFYAWGEPKYVLLMICATAVAWAGGLLMERYMAAANVRKNRHIFVVTVTLILANLAVFKYANFAWSNISALFGFEDTLAKIALPIGISFYTFQILSYVIDLYRGKVSVQKDPLKLLLYVSCFPQLIAGPIVRYETVETEIGERQESLDDVIEGLKRFIIGLAKKVILANRLALVADIIYSGDSAVYGSAMYWVAALAFTLQLYFDFSGYSDMAIGLGRIFGFHFLENFRHPYISHSITEFWRRWHISLSSWFKDYVYIPLGGNRVSKAKWLRNILIVWFLTGLWHGAEWSFVIWGLYYAALLIIEKLWLGKLMEKLPSPLSWFITFVLVIVGSTILNLSDLSILGNALGVMFSFAPTDWAAMLASELRIDIALLYIPLGLIFSLPLLEKIKPPKSAVGETMRLVGYGLLFGVSIVYTVSSSYSPFIYFRF